MSREFIFNEDTVFASWARRRLGYPPPPALPSHDEEAQWAVATLMMEGGTAAVNLRTCGRRFAKALTYARRRGLATEDFHTKKEVRRFALTDAGIAIGRMEKAEGLAALAERHLQRTIDGMKREPAADCTTKEEA